MPIRLKKKASEGDIVELRVDLPNSNFKKGHRGAVITTFLEPREAYDLEMVSESGDLLGYAYSVAPEQFDNLSLDAFVRSMQAIEQNDLLTAEKQLRLAVDLRPESIGFFVNSILASFADEDLRNEKGQLSLLIPLFRLALRVRPDYEIARTNLAIAFLKFGVRKGNEGDLEDAFELFLSALSIKTDQRTENIIRNNLSLVLTSFGEQLFAKEHFDEGLNSFRSALLAFQNEVTSRNLGLAYGIHGASLMERQQFDLAMQQFDRAEDAGVVISDFIVCNGICLAMTGQVKQAHHEFKRALHIDPSNSDALFNIKLLKTRFGTKNLREWSFLTRQSTRQETQFGHGDFLIPVWQPDAFVGDAVVALS